MSLYRIFFPLESRSLWGKRWLNVVFRSLHLCSIGIYTGGVFFDISSELVMPSYIIAALSGLAIMAMDLYSNGKWIFQNRGLFIVIKIVLLGVLPHLGSYTRWGVLGIIIFSSYISHATADVRYFSVFHRKRI
ncbi:hypothetical protein KJ966_02590 [bacterium]|nr:hypothetical protein [bacterium]